MPSLNWTNFNALSGSRSQNFENLCRALMRVLFERFGQFKALRNQPGVEFHLELSEECPNLGAPPRWYGWQCKFHELTTQGHLRASSKQNIEHSLRITEQHLPNLTDWVLWTPYTLSRQDQEWFTGLQTRFTLHQWNEEEIDTYLSGPGLILRSTYFGDLIATSQELKIRHSESIQPIRAKWFEPVHQLTEAERTLRKMLGESGSWNHLIKTGKRLEKAADSISEFLNATKNFPRDIVSQFIETCREFAAMLLDFHKVLAAGDLEIVQQQLRERQFLMDEDIKSTPRRLRSLNVPITIDATNALHDMRIAQELLNEVEDFLGVGLVALLADAGGGKTQIAAELTAPQKNRDAGVLLHGQNLHRGKNLNDLARNFSLNGKPLDSIEQLLASLDAAAKRNRCRLPLVIDGLNEAENPRDWQAPLASLCETVKAYPNVLVVCTLRTGEHARKDLEGRDLPQTTTTRESFAVMSLPGHLGKIKSDGFGSDTEDAIARYFEYFKINPGEAEIPIEFLQHPLNLRIFCQVTNPDRKSMTTVDFFPASMVPLFEKFVENSVTRISELPNLSHPYRPEDVNVAVYKLGLMLWEGQRREISERSFRDAVSDTGRPWDSSIVNLLTQEGIIFRNPGDTPYEYVITPTYDALGGFIIANSLLTKYVSDTPFEWLNDPDTINSFSGNKSHELASDTFRAIVALTPVRMNGKQLWTVAPVFRNAALRFTTLLNAEFLDTTTVNALKQLFTDNPKDRQWLYSRLYATRAAVDHPLNANFLDAVLRPLVPASERDLSWTEWIRLTRDERFSDLLTVEERWKTSRSKRLDSDRLRAKWIMWHLTSTDRELRDVATRALYWFGRGDPSTLFKDTLLSLEITDPYVSERMFAASYGVAMALQGGFDDSSFSATILSDYARKIFDALFVEGAPYRTTHLLLREYAMRIIELAALHDPALFSTDELAKTNPPFSTEGLPAWGEKNIDRTRGEASPFRMDFENYTLGRLVPGRQNYDYKHEGYKKIKSQVLWRIEQLGWSGEQFGEIDKRIAQNQERTRGNNPMKTDRYGKKYSWIAYFEMSGLLRDQGAIDQTYDRERTADVDIDPSFPELLPKAEIIDIDLLGDAMMGMEEWIANGEQPDMTPYLRMMRVGKEKGPWILLDGFVIQDDENRGRQSFCFLRSFIVKNATANEFFAHLSQQELGGRWLPEKPEVFYTFAGEIPWCRTYPINGPSEFAFVVKERMVKIERTRTELYLDGKKLEMSAIDLFRYRILGMQSPENEDERLTDDDWAKIEVREIPYEEEEVKPEFATFKALIPVCDFGWEGYQSAASDAGRAVTLAKEIAEDLDLINCPQEFDFFTADGVRATLGISDQSDDYNNHQSIFFMRENLLQAYLKKNDCSLVWVIWGERGYSVKLATTLFHGPERPAQTHGDIRQIIRYEMLAEFLRDHVGVLNSSEHVPGGARMSEDTGRKFTEILIKKHRRRSK